ncbi:MAG: histidine kinase [Spirochaetales bacterium]|nr:histidine kinase [Spirochaetales bacterium]
MVDNSVRRYFSRLRQRVFLLLLLFTVVPLALAGAAFFVVSREAVVDSARQQSAGYLELAAASLQFLLEDVAETSLDFIRSDNLLDTLSSADGIRPAGAPTEEQSDMVAELAYAVAANRQIHSVTLFDNDGDRVSTGNRYLEYGTAFREAERRAGAGSWRLVPTPAHRSTHTLSYIRLVRDYRDIRRHIGFLAVDLDEREVSLFLRDGAPFASTRSYLVDDSGRVVAAGGAGTLGVALAALIADDDVVIRRRLSGELPFTVVQASDRREVLGQVRIVALFFALALTALAAICALFALWVSKRVVAPVTELTGLLRQVEGNNYRITAPVRGDDEIAELSRQFNAMVRRIRTLFDEVYVAQIHERDAELRALQSQINPHFLHNTLNALYLNARFEDAPETGSLIREFSSLMRYSMQTDRPVVSLEEEVEHAKNYLALQKHRIGERLVYRWEVAEETAEREVLRLILQPIVENAIVHGLETSAEHLEIVVRVYAAADEVVYEVTDNGPGIEGSLEATLDTADGIGLRNVRERLELYFSDAYRLELSRCEGGGTRVTVRQPRHRRARGA